MELDVQRFDVSNQVAAGQSPALFMQRSLPGNDGERRIIPASADLASVDEWHILQTKIGEGSDWAIDRVGTQVRIPFFEYVLPDDAPEILVHLGAQLASVAAFSLPQGREFNKFLLAIGNVFQRPDGQPGYQVWVGFAARAD